MNLISGRVRSLEVKSRVRETTVARREGKSVITASNQVAFVLRVTSPKGTCLQAQRDESHDPFDTSSKVDFSASRIERQSESPTFNECFP